jgi:protein TonB
MNLQAVILFLPSSSLNRCGRQSQPRAIVRQLCANSTQACLPAKTAEGKDCIDIDRGKGSTTMIARVEMSTNMQNSEREPGVSGGMSVAVIGPNDAHRTIVANALSSEDGRSIYQFADYPGQLNDLPRFLGQNFDVVLVDVDTDESYAMQIIEKLAELGPAVMAYSARNDQELLMSCMRAGARDFLPLPSENNSAPSPAPEPAPKPVAATSQAIPRPAEPRVPPTNNAPIVARPSEPKPGAVSIAPRPDVTPIVPERRLENLEQRASWVTAEAAEPVDQIDDPVADVLVNSAKSAAPMKDTAAFDILKEASQADTPASDFAEWDAANLRRAQAPPVKRPEPRLRPSLVPERRKPEAPPRAIPSVVPSVDPPPVQAAERPPVPVELFRASQMPHEISEEAERQGTNWLKWILIGAGPVVLALVLLIVFTHPSAQSSAPTSAKPPATPAETPAPSEGQLIADATGNSANTAATRVSKPSPAQVSETAAQPEISDPKPVAPDAMAQQLVAPERIAGNIKTNPTVDAPPPAAPNATALEDNTAIPGSVFGGSSKAKFVPRVMPISAGVADGMIIRRTQPVYPRFAQDAHITGKVVLKATITKQGSIEGVQVLSGPKILAPAAVDAVKTWKYRPYALDGQPVAVETTVTIVFGSTR